MKDFDVQRKPFVVPVDDGKLIEEHFDQPCEYLAVCTPAFQIGKAHREEE